MAIICYYGRARSLCYPTIETGGAPGNLMTHKSRHFFGPLKGQRALHAIFSIFKNPILFNQLSPFLLSLPDSLWTQPNQARRKGLWRLNGNNINCFNVVLMFYVEFLL